MLFANTIYLYGAKYHNRYYIYRRNVLIEVCLPQWTPHSQHPPPPNFRKRNQEHAKRFLGANQEEYGLGSEDIELVYKNNVRGRDFLRLTSDLLCKSPFNCSWGGAGAIIELTTAVTQASPCTGPRIQCLMKLPIGLTAFHQQLINPLWYLRTSESWFQP